MKTSRSACSSFGVLGLVTAIMIVASNCKTMSPPPPPEVERIVYQHRPKEKATGPVTLKRDEFTQAELTTLDEFLESRAGKRVDQPFASMTVSPCGGCRTHDGKEQGKEHGNGIWMSI